MSQRSGILLFNSRGTCAHCLGSRRCFNVNTSFTDDDRILIEIYTFLKVTVQKKLIKEFPDRGLALSSLNKLLKNSETPVAQREEAAVDDLEQSG